MLYHSLGFEQQWQDTRYRRRSRISDFCHFRSILYLVNMLQKVVELGIYIVIFGGAGGLSIGICIMILQMDSQRDSHSDSDINKCLHDN